MKFAHQYARAAIALALSTVTCVGHAADKAIVPVIAADADVIVPATRYQSFLPYSPAAASNRSPDQNWKVLNDQVGAYDSMSLTLGGAAETKPAETAQVDAPTNKAAALQEGQSAHIHSAAATAHRPDRDSRKDAK